ncbi:MAG TPA: UdgX family uracil-DNA binding protein [Candidatus Limnocylindria bacterium]
MPDEGYPDLPKRPSLPQLREAVQACRACDLWARATQGVFGEGKRGAKVMFVGEQPGDQEDRKGLPFVGPAGRLLDEALVEAGIDRTAVYVTNTVKHFKWRAAGKRRIHEKPNATEIAACRFWLETELDLFKPRIIVALGATAAQALFGNAFRVTKQRGKPVPTPLAPHGVATVHPSSILRAPDEVSRRAEYKAFVADLKVVAQLIGAH